MQKKLLAVAMLGAFAGAAFAQSSVTAFGILDVGVRYVDNDSAGHQWTMATDGSLQSRLGFRGTEDLGDGLKAGFWLESAVAADTGTANAQRFWHRRSTVSLISDSLGELRLGRDNTATYWNLNVFDPFNNNGVGAMTTLFPAAVASQAVQTLVRADNVVGYFLPGNLGGIYGQAQYAAGEGNDDNKYVGGRIGYAAGPLDVALAYGQTWTTTPQRVKTWDAGVSYDFGIVKLFGQYAYLEYDQWDRTNYLVGATVPVGVAGLVRASYTYSKFDGPGCPPRLTNCDDGNQVALGYVHNLSKRTALYTTAALLDNASNGAISIPGGPAGIGRGEKSVGVEMGMRHAF